MSGLGKILCASVLGWVLISPAMAQQQVAAGIMFDGADNVLPLRQTALPPELLTPLFAAGRGEPVQDLSLVLNPEVLDAARQAFDLSSAQTREEGAAQLELLAEESVEATNLLAAAAELDLVDVEGRQVPLLVNASREGSVVAQRSLDIFYAQDGLEAGQFAVSATDLEERYLNGEAMGSENLLAQYFQYGMDGQVNFEKAETYWQLAVETNNPESLTGYASFLIEQGRVEDATPYLYGAALQGHFPAIAALYQYNPSGVPDEIRANYEYPGSNASSEVKVILGDMQRDLGTEEGARAAAQYYLAAIEGPADVEIAKARAMSRLGDLYLVWLGLEPEFNQENALALYNRAAGMGDAGGLLGLAKEALARGNLPAAYNLASRVAELGDDVQGAAADAIRTELCQPITQFECAPIPVFFATTRRPVPAADPTSFDTIDTHNVQLAIGIRFVRVPVTSATYDRRLKLYDAARATAISLFGSGAEAKIDAGLPLLFNDGSRMTEFIAAVQEVAANAGMPGVFVFVHGYANSFDAASEVTALTSEHADFPSVPFLLSWASRGNVGLYPADTAAVTNSCVRLLGVLRALGGAFGGSQITLLAHSMGAKLTYAMIGGCEGSGENHWDLPDEIGNVIYAAPDVGWGFFKANFDTQREAAAAITLYATTSDSALQLSRSVNDELRAGLGGNMLVMTLPDLTTIDATNVEYDIFSGGDFWNHGYVFSRPEVIADLGRLMNAVVDPHQRPCLDETTTDPPYFMIEKGCLGP